MQFPNARILLALVPFGAVTMMLVALYMQHVMYLHPCNLCIVQRVFVIFTGILGLVGVLHVAKLRAWAVMTAISALIGSLFSMRQLYLQSLPPEEVPACGPGLEYLFDALPFQRAVEQLLMGDGNCAEVQWSFLTLTIPGWTLVAFFSLAIIAGSAAYKAKYA